MNIQGYPKLLNYCNAILHPQAPKPGSFLTLFCRTCLAADWENFELMRPLLEKVMQKYPAEPERLGVEEEDSK